ncbi:uncharacterized protein LOC133823071 isoform X2 [Humulus lupulus]|uniref:uncharacterized protein LOC133823071 isoform X2 n=1 Tax=Humulus lupulus TaxID=3486 RepID=UPI002B41014A|nr:uncharacterized protein LOC133823071 isoform X2 [Humulus lupulus]XP_062111640.1 uncharacterized protein LOC133823071 isoform X2 [Humulus lupulus]
MIPPTLLTLPPVLRPRVKQSAGRYRTRGGSSRILGKSMAHKLPISAQVLEMLKRYSDSCEDMGRSGLTMNKLSNMLQAHKLPLNLKFVIPERDDRATEPPKGFVAFSDSIIRSGGALPLLPFFVKVLNYFELAPLQLSPNSRVTLSSLYVLYHQVHSRGPSINEVHYFYTLRENASAPGFYQLQKAADQKGTALVVGSISNRDSWKTDYFFTFSGSTPKSLETEGSRLKLKARDLVMKILALSSDCKQASALFIESNLCFYRLLTPNRTVSLCSVSSEPVSQCPASSESAGPHPVSPKPADPCPAPPKPANPCPPHLNLRVRGYMATMKVIITRYPIWTMSTLWVVIWTLRRQWYLRTTCACTLHPTCLKGISSFLLLVGLLYPGEAF